MILRHELRSVSPVISSHDLCTSSMTALMFTPLRNSTIDFPSSFSMMSLRNSFFLYRLFRDNMTPWSFDWIKPVTFGGRNLANMAPSSLTKSSGVGCAEQLSRIRRAVGFVVVVSTACEPMGRSLHGTKHYIGWLALDWLEYFIGSIDLSIFRKHLCLLDLLTRCTGSLIVLLAFEHRFSVTRSFPLACFSKRAMVTLGSKR